MRQNPSLRRGQGTLELALMSVLIIGMLLGGLFLSEVQILGFRVHEAASYAALNIAAEPLQQLSGTGVAPDHDSALANINSDADMRFRDFDGRSKAEPTRTAQLALAGADSLQVRCFREVGADLAAWDSRSISANTSQWVNVAGLDDLGALVVNRHSDRLDNDPQYVALVNLVQDQFTNEGGFGCTAQANILSDRLANNFFTRSKGGFFNQSVAGLTSGGLFTLCSPGRSDGNGTCPGRFTVLSGDLALDDARAPSGFGDPQRMNEDCRFRTCASSGNTAYRDRVRAIYQANLGDFASNTNGGFLRWGAEMAKSVNEGQLPPGHDIMAGEMRNHGPDTYSEEDFYMSFAGENDNQTNSLWGANPTSAFMDGFPNRTRRSNTASVNVVPYGMFNTSGASAGLTRENMNAEIPDRMSWGGTPSGSWAGANETPGLSNWKLP